MDIVERLRKVFGVVVKADDCFEEDYSVAREAADEIERLRQQVADLMEVIKITLNACGGVIVLPEHSDDGEGHEYCFVCGADHDEPHDDDCIIPKLQAVIAKATGGE